jgi:hypothetical protein
LSEKNQAPIEEVNSGDSFKQNEKQLDVLPLGKPHIYFTNKYKALVRGRPPAGYPKRIQHV